MIVFPVTPKVVATAYVPPSVRKDELVLDLSLIPLDRIYGDDVYVGPRTRGEGQSFNRSDVESIWPSLAKWVNRPIHSGSSIDLKLLRNWPLPNLTVTDLLYGPVLREDRVSRRGGLILDPVAASYDALRALDWKNQSAFQIAHDFEKAAKDVPEQKYAAKVGAAEAYFWAAMQILSEDGFKDAQIYREKGNADDKGGRDKVAAARRDAALKLLKLASGALEEVMKHAKELGLFETVQSQGGRTRAWGPGNQSDALNRLLTHAEPQSTFLAVPSALRVSALVATLEYILKEQQRTYRTDPVQLSPKLSELIQTLYALNTPFVNDANEQAALSLLKNRGQLPKNLENTLAYQMIKEATRRFPRGSKQIEAQAKAASTLESMWRLGDELPKVLREAIARECNGLTTLLGEGVLLNF